MLYSEEGTTLSRIDEMVYIIQGQKHTHKRHLNQLKKTSLSEPLPRALIFVIVKLRGGLLAIVRVCTNFFDIFLITYFCVVSSFEPPLDHNRMAHFLYYYHYYFLAISLAQQVSSRLQDSSQYFVRSPQCYSLGGHDSSLYFPLFQSPYQAFEVSSEWANYNWYYRYLHVTQLFLVLW